MILGNASCILDVLVQSKGFLQKPQILATLSRQKEHPLIPVLLTEEYVLVILVKVDNVKVVALGMIMPDQRVQAAPGVRGTGTGGTARRLQCALLPAQ